MDQCFPHPREMDEHDEQQMGKSDVAAYPINSPIQGNNSGSGGGFDCSICLDLVQDPVVTLCGHLFCWPCIYKWMNVNPFFPEKSEEQTQCPVCKAGVSERTLIPLYGRGQSYHESDGKSSSLYRSIPQRPAGPLCGVHTLVAATTMDGSSAGQQLYRYRRHPRQLQTYYNHLGDQYGASLFSFSDTTGMFHSSASMFGEMIYAWIFGDQTSLYDYPDSYHLSGLGSLRVRRRVMLMYRSLSRISFFFLCFVVFCLLLF